MGRTPELAHEIAACLGRIDGVSAVALGGSWARGEARPDSDVDLGIYYRDADRPSVESLDELARELGYRDPSQPVTDFGGWGPWVNGGAWLLVAGVQVDLLYRDLDEVSRVIDDCRNGKTSVHYQPGHPHGFHSHIYMGEVHHCRPLFDPDGELASLKELTDTYPPQLRHALVKTQLWEARFSLETSRKPAARGDAAYVAGCLFRSAACATQALFALNERYLINEKGAVGATDVLPVRPPNFKEDVESVLAEPGRTPGQLTRSIARLEELVGSVEKLRPA